MIETFQEFIENTNFNLVIGAFAAYIFLLWLLIPIWVFLDARKKFDNKYLSILFFILILPFNIPGLIFYIIIRPDENIIADLNNDGVPDAFFSVPIVNFLSQDKKDLVMGLELKINSELISPELRKDLKLKVDFETNESTVKIEEPKAKEIKKEDNDKSENKKSKSKIKSIFSAIKDFFIVKEEESEKKEEVKDSQATA